MRCFLYKTDRDIRKMLGFYYNRLPGAEHEVVTFEKGVKAVVAPQVSVSDVERVYGPNMKTVLLNNAGGTYNYAVRFYHALEKVDDLMKNHDDPRR